MRKITLIFGLLAGVTLSTFLVIGCLLFPDYMISVDNSELIGYGSMVIALSMIFFGIKSYRDNYGNGAIGFLKGLQVGMLITLVASLIYAVAGETLYQVDPDGQAAMMEKLADHQINKMKEKGASSIEIEETTKQMTDLKEMHKNPLLRFAMTLAIILPVGIVITLISAALLRKKEFLQTNSVPSEQF